MDESSSRRWTLLDWKLLVLLGLLAGGIRAWQMTHTVVAARDSIGFIRHAWQYRQADVARWAEVLRGSEQHPLYPLWVLAVSRVLELFHPGPTTTLMQHSTQVASSLMAILLVLPLYLLGRELFDRRVGFLTALILQCLPVSGRILSDGLSEATFLFFASFALYGGIVALNRPRRYLAFALTGLCGGLAYLTRPEGALVVAATGIMLLIGQVVAHWRRGWRETFLAGTSLGVTALIIASPIVLLTGKLTLKPTGGKIIANEMASLPSTSAGPLLGVWDLDDGKPADQRGLWGAMALFRQLGKASFYFGWIAATLGLWSHRRRLLDRPGVWMLLLVSVLVAFALWRVAVVAGYLSDRHTLLLLTSCTPFGAAGMILIGEAISRRWPRMTVAPMFVPAACVLACLPKTLEPLHENRAGFREAGEWLARHSHPTDPITDPLCWSHFYAGRVFLEHTQWNVPTAGERREYVVIEEAGNAHPRVPAFREAVEKAKKGECVKRWTVKRGKKRADVLIYAIPIAGEQGVLP
jgi:hypothetical protein